MKKGFTLDSDAKDHFILKHSDGHTLRVAKKGISPEIKKVIESFACGGMVKGYAQGDIVEDPTEGIKPVEDVLDPNNIGTPGANSTYKHNIYRQYLPPPPGLIEPGSGRIKQIDDIISKSNDPAQIEKLQSERNKLDPTGKKYISQPTVQSAAAESAQPAINANVPLGTESEPEMMTAAYMPPQQQPMMPSVNNPMVQGLRNEASALAAQNEFAANQIQGEMDQYNKLKSNIDERIRLNIEAKNAMAEEIKNFQLDPNRVWKNKSTGNKVLSLIGIILGGYGHALGGSNPALKIIDDEIDRDIEAQKAEFGAKKTALDSYVAEYGNLQDASQALRLDMQAMVMAQTQLAANKFGGKVAEARSQQAIAQQMQSMSAGINSLETKRAIREYLNQPDMDPMERANTLDFAKTVDSDWGKSLEKDYASVTEIEERRRNIENSLDTLKGMISKKGTWEAFGSHNQDLDRIVDQVATDMAKLQDPQSIARPNEVELVKRNLISSGFTNSNATAIKLLDNFRKEITSRTEQAYKVRGLKAPKSKPSGTPAKTTQSFAQK